VVLAHYRLHHHVVCTTLPYPFVLCAGVRVYARAGGRVSISVSCCCCLNKLIVTDFELYHIERTHSCARLFYIHSQATISNNVTRWLTPCQRLSITTTIVASTIDTSLFLSLSLSLSLTVCLFLCHRISELLTNVLDCNVTFDDQCVQVTSMVNTTICCACSSMVDTHQRLTTCSSVITSIEESKVSRPSACFLLSRSSSLRTSSCFVATTSVLLSIVFMVSMMSVCLSASTIV
jgi:hypothetical protein